MKKIYFLFVFLLFVSCGRKTGIEMVGDTAEFIAYIPGTRLIAAGESLNPDYIFEVGLDQKIYLLENKSNTVIDNPEEKYREILTEIREELAANRKITRCKKEKSMWIGEMGLRLTVEGAISGNKGQILACYHKGNKTLINPNYQVRTDLPLVEVRIEEKYYEIASYTAVLSYNNRTLK